MEKDYQMKIEQISKEINSIIKDHIRIDSPEKIRSYEEYMSDILDRFDDEIKSTREIIDDYAKENLSINMIEMEGYLRGLLTMKDYIVHNKKYYIKDDENSES